MEKSNNSFIFTKQIKNMRYKLIIFILTIITLFIFFNSQKVYAATAKVSISPKNPRVGDTVTVKTEISGTDAYSIHFIKLEESSNLEYISMDSQKKAEGTTPLTGDIKATYKVKEGGVAWISLEYKIESASLVDKKLNLDSITSKTFEEKIDVKIVPSATNVQPLNATFEVTDNDVNIRPHPSTTYSSIGSYKKGKQINVTGLTGDWYQFKFDLADAYISKDFVKEIKTEAEIIEEPTDIKTDDNIQEEIVEEVKDPKVKDPKDTSSNTTVLIIVAVIIAAGIIAALVYLFKQGKEKKDDEPKYGMQNIEEDTSSFKKRSGRDKQI